MQPTESLLKAAQNGDHQAFSDIMSQLQGSLYQHALKICGNREDALETIQETFLNAYKNITHFRGDSHLLTWLIRIATNSCLMSRRRSKFAPEKHATIDETLLDTSESITSSEKIPSPEAEALRLELLTRLAHALEALPESYRSVLLLRDLDGLKTEEVAQAMQISPAAVKSRLHRARAYIREQMQPYVNL